MLEIMLIGAALAGALAFMAGIFENEDSDAGSASNPNSQVQLAPQIGHLHRYYNKAIAGEPPQNALWAAFASTIAVLLLTDGAGMLHILIASVIGAAFASILQGAYGFFAHISRIASMGTFKQVMYWDALRSALPLSMSFVFLSSLSLTLVSFILHEMVLNPFSVPLIAMFLGFTIGTIGSSTGDIHYGAERLYQHYIFGSGIAISKQGDIDVKGEYGYRNSVDTPYFTLRFGGPLTGLTFGMLIFLDALTKVFDTWTSIALEFALVLVLFVIAAYLEKYTRNKYGPYTDGEENR